MDNQTVINPTGEPVTEQAPTMDTPSTSTPSASTPSTSDTTTFDGGEIQGRDIDMAEYEESVIYQILIPNEYGVYRFEVFIDPKVYHFGWRDAEIERIVTGTHHVTVSSPRYCDVPIDENVYVTCDNEGEIVLHVEKLTSDNEEDIYNE